MTNETETSSTAGIRVFVYGTLKRGHENHFLLSGAEFLGRAKLHGDYAMLDLTYYPGCVRTRGIPSYSRRNIFGEVYLVDEETLYSLDLLEGNGKYFTRSKVATAEWKNAWMYFLPEEYLKDHKFVNGGAWNPDDAEQEFIASVS